MYICISYYILCIYLILFPSLFICICLFLAESGYHPAWTDVIFLPSFPPLCRLSYAFLPKLILKLSSCHFFTQRFPGSSINWRYFHGICLLFTLFLSHYFCYMPPLPPFYTVPSPWIAYVSSPTHMSKFHFKFCLSMIKVY